MRYEVWSRKTDYEVRPEYLLKFAIGAQEQIRTATPVKAPPPQSGASTNFATWALIIFYSFKSQKNIAFFYDSLQIYKISYEFILKERKIATP